ncbi:MAG: PaaI family thioesterase [Solirubrobacteraceae bacterium]
MAGDEDAASARRRGSPLDVDAAQRSGVMKLLGIEVVSSAPERVELHLRVGERVHQPFGYLHGGVSALLAETAASIGGCLAAPGRRVVGVELNASHLRPMRDGTLVAVATPVRIGRSLQVWDIALTDGARLEVCRARCTLAVGAPPARVAAAE